jgi:hypothetical protein
MQASQKIDTPMLLYRLGLILSGLILAALCLFSVLKVGLCTLDDPVTYGSCVKGSLAVSGTLETVILAITLAARKYPFISGLVLISTGVILMAMFFLFPYYSYYLLFDISLFIDGLLFLSVGCFDQSTWPRRA